MGGGECPCGGGNGESRDEHCDPGDYRYLYRGLGINERILWGGPRGTAEAPGIHHADLRLLLFGCRGSPGSAAFGPGYEGTAGAGGDIRGCSGVFEDYLSRNAVYLSV